jgi:mono/diheme cytochrome c family protein
MRVPRLGLGILAICAAAGCNPFAAKHPTPGGPGFPDPGDGVGGSGGPQPVFDEPAKTSAKPPAPLIGGTLMVLKGGTTALVADPDRDQVQIVDLSGNRVTATIALSAGDEPGRAVQDAAGLVHVAARRGGALVSIDPQAGVVTNRRAICAAPRGVAYDATTDSLHVACAGGELVSLPAAGGGPTRVVQLERDIRDVVVSKGTLIVSTFRTAQLLVLNADGSVGKRFALPSVSDPFSGQPFASAVAWRMQSMPDGRILVVHQQGAVGEVQISQGGYGGGGGCGSIVRSSLAIFDPGSLAMSDATPLPGVVLPADFALAPTQGTVAILSAGNSHTPGMPTVGTLPLAVVSAPPVTQPGPDGGSDVDGGVFIGQPGGGGGGDCGSVSGVLLLNEPIALAYDGDENLWVQQREPAALTNTSTGSIIPLANDSRADTGWAVFHSNSGAGLACASCHPEGKDDSRTWNFQDVGPRRTQTLAGHVGGTEPFHWGGDLHDFGALLGEVYIKRMSGPTLLSDQSSQLFAWINTIPELPQSPPADPAAAARGKTLFDDPTKGCATCHSPATVQLTNNATVDVGTGGMFQVPRLLGVAWRAPFLHDGCAATLLDRFGPCGGGDNHGVTSTLTDAQRSDLVSYLETL